MADFKVDQRGWAEFKRSRSLGASVFRVAQEEAATLAARTPKDTGETAGTTHAEPAMFSDRVGAWIVQEGAAVQTNFGNARVAGQHYATRGR